jgi:hypothetical protein
MSRPGIPFCERAASQKESCGRAVESKKIGGSHPRTNAGYGWPSPPCAGVLCDEIRAMASQFLDTKAAAAIMNVSPSF